MNTETKTIPAEVLMNGGRSITVKTLDGSTVDVKVRLVPIREIGRYLELIGNMPEFIAFIIGKDAKFVDSLVDECLYLIDDTAKELNDFRVGRFIERQKQTRKQIGLVTDQITASQTSPQTPLPVA